MGKTVDYIRISTEKKNLNNQKLEILENARHNGLSVDELGSQPLRGKQVSNDGLMNFSKD